MAQRGQRASRRLRLVTPGRPERERLIVGGSRALGAGLIKPRVRTMIVLAIAGVPVVVFFVVARVATSALWFQSLDQGDAFVRMSAAKLLLVLIVGVVTTVF